MLSESWTDVRNVVTTMEQPPKVTTTISPGGPAGGHVVYGQPEWHGKAVSSSGCNGSQQKACSSSTDTRPWRWWSAPYFSAILLSPTSGNRSATPREYSKRWLPTVLLPGHVIQRDQSQERTPELSLGDWCPCGHVTRAHRLQLPADFC